MIWDTVIGLEVHAQLRTRSKLFSGSSVQYGAEANTQTSYIDAGLPGVLPVVNKQAVLLALRFGLAIHGEIQKYSIFERKNYFYPDLPKGYQISQYQHPIITNGYLTIPIGSKKKNISILRAHLEEDAGKSLHEAHSYYTGIDLNRAGTPLLEIVTTPCLHSAKEAVLYLKTLHHLITFLDVCDGNMQEGSFRCDVNLSLKPKNSKQLGTRTEIKNLNSFRFIEKAIDYEQKRQQDILENGGTVIQETRLFCPETETTILMREKEKENDYRYFPDPDLLPLCLSQEDIDTVKESLPQLPEEIKTRLSEDPALSEDDIRFIISTQAVYRFFCSVKEQSKADNKVIVNWLQGTYAPALSAAGLDFENPPLSASLFADLLDKIAEKALPHRLAKIIFSKLWQGETDIDALIEKEGLQKLETDFNLGDLIQEIISQHPQQAADYQAGKEKLLAFFIGLVMKQTKGKGNPEQIGELFKYFLQK